MIHIHYFSLWYYKTSDVFKFTTLGGRSSEILTVTCFTSTSWYDHYTCTYIV